MELTKNHLYIALGVAAVAGFALWLNRDKKDNSAMIPKGNTLSEKDTKSTFSTFTTNEIGRTAGEFSSVEASKPVCKSVCCKKECGAGVCWCPKDQQGKCKECTVVIKGSSSEMRSFNPSGSNLTPSSANF